MIKKQPIPFLCPQQYNVVAYTCCSACVQASPSVYTDNCWSADLCVN